MEIYEDGPICQEARVVNIKKTMKGVEVAFVYYNRSVGNVHFDRISPQSCRYNQALSLCLGDEVWAARREDDAIFDFVIHNPFERFMVRTFKAAISKLVNYFNSWFI